MKKFFSAAIIPLTFVLFLQSFAQAPERDVESEEPILTELRKIAPDKVEVFVAATRALDQEDFDEASRLYLEVLGAVPEFPPALRRRGFALVSLGLREEGLAQTAKALELERSVDNLTGHASTLLDFRNPDFVPSESESKQAVVLGKEAWELSQESDVIAAVVLTQALVQTRDATALRRYLPIFLEKFPDVPNFRYYWALQLAEEGNFSESRDEIARLHNMGFPEEATAPLEAAMIEAEDQAYFGLGRFFRYINIFFILVGLWGVGLAALFVVGRSLSKKTLMSIEESDPNDLAGEQQKRLNEIYRKVISIAGIYYYLSQPIVILIVIVATLGAFVFFLWIGRIPIYWMFGLALVGLGTIYYMVKSWVTRVKIEDPGRVLLENEAPELWKLVRDVAQKINTRPVDEIRITHGAEVAVYERGSFRSKLSDTAERVLILGAAALNDFEIGAFKAVIAHEYGHFSNRDTAGGEIALRVNVDIERVAAGMVNAGTATFYNLGFQFLRLFHFLFRRITYGATRLQEVLADRVAAHHFGPEVFRAGLTHVIRREIEFNRIADAEVSTALARRSQISNLYEMNIIDEAAKLEIDQELNSYLNRPTTDDDTHPSPKDRFRYVEKITPANIDREEGTVWSLFKNRDQITSEMSNLIDSLVREHRSSEDSSILGI